jgi:hypothetical protein
MLHPRPAPNTDLPSELPGDVWNAENGRTFAAQAGG